jgi:hypothetical protein
MVTGNTVGIDPGTYGEDSGAIIVMQKGAIIGVFSQAAQEDAQTLRMTFTRDAPERDFVPLQGVIVQQFEKFHSDSI